MFKISKNAAREIIHKLLQEIEVVTPPSTRDIAVDEEGDTFRVSINLALRQLRPIPEVGEYIQKQIFEGFKNATGIELASIDLFIEEVSVSGK